MKLRLVQKDINDRDIKKHLDAVEPGSVDIVCFPELAVSGCLYSGGEVPSFDETIDLLSRYDCATFIGLPRQDEKGRRNSYLYFSGGQYQIYDKINLFEPMNENVVYVPGEEPGVIETEFGRFGVAVCYDLRFPELFQDLAAQNVNWIIVPAAWPIVRIADWHRLIIERATETGCHVIGVNTVGDDGVNIFGGTSKVAAPDGRILAQADETREQIVAVQI